MRAFLRRELLRSSFCVLVNAMCLDSTSLPGQAAPGLTGGTVFQIRLTALLGRALHLITVQNPLTVVG